LKQTEAFHSQCSIKSFCGINQSNPQKNSFFQK